jgi:hypothetical protein
MIEKELRMFLVAYNCIRSLMVESAIKHHLSIERISFKGTVDTLASFAPVLFHTTARRTLTTRRQGRRILFLFFLSLFRTGTRRAARGGR